uniref:Uncharacterized protein n=1 Tax=Onchocerca volvulus TaxID=6282 RepID=A0A8R1TUS9_ONCVO
MLVSTISMKKFKNSVFGITAVKSFQHLLLKCFAYLILLENGLIIGHMNTIEACFEINKTVNYSFFFFSSFLEKIPIGQPVYRIGSITVSEYYIGSTIHLFLPGADKAHFLRLERPLIKRSVTDEKCTIGPKSKIINCLVIDGVRLNVSQLFPSYDDRVNVAYIDGVELFRYKAAVNKSKIYRITYRRPSAL